MIYRFSERLPRPPRSWRRATSKRRHMPEEILRIQYAIESEIITRHEVLTAMEAQRFEIMSRVRLRHLRHPPVLQPQQEP